MYIAFFCMMKCGNNLMFKSFVYKLERVMVRRFLSFIEKLPFPSHHP